MTHIHPAASIPSFFAIVLSAALAVGEGLPDVGIAGTGSPAGDASAGGAKRLVIGDVPEHTVGAYRPFMIPGEIDEADGLVECRKGRTIVVWCPERVAQEAPDKAAAAKRFIDSPFLPIGSVSVGYVGDPRGEAVLKELGVRYTAFGPRNIYDFGKNQVVALGPGTDALFRDDNLANALKSLLSSHPVLVLPEADLSLLPFGLSRKTEALSGDAASATVPDLPLFAGTVRDFRDFVARAKGTVCPVMDNGPAWMLPTSPACFALVKNRGNSVILLTIAPSDVPDVARPALTRVWCTMLANLNIETGCD